MFRPGFPRLSHPGLAHATPSTGFMAQVYRGAGKLTDQQRAEQAPADDWDDLLMPEIHRQQAAGRRVAFRADAAFARPAIYDTLE